MLKFDSRWNAPVRLPFRIIAFFLSMLCILMGTLALISTFNSCPVEFDTSFKSGISGLITGVILLIVAIRGRIIKKDIG